MDGRAQARSPVDIEFVWNVPFEQIPHSFIMQIAGIDSTEYIRLAHRMKFAYWNIVALNGDGEIICVAWGLSCPIEHLTIVMRISAHPKTFSVRGWIVDAMLDEIVKLARTYRAERVIWMTDRPHVFIRKLGDRIRLADTSVIEVVK